MDFCRPVGPQEYDPNPSRNERRYWVSVMQTNVLPRVVLDKCLKFFGLNHLDVLRCHMDRVDDPGNGHVSTPHAPSHPRPRWPSD